jgi:hypothetical protein
MPGVVETSLLPFAILYPCKRRAWCTATFSHTKITVLWDGILCSIRHVPEDITRPSHRHRNLKSSETLLLNF